jgi:hypothetical protein
LTREFRQVDAAIRRIDAAARAAAEDPDDDEAGEDAGTFDPASI